MKINFDHEHLVVSNAEETATFYEKTFGATRRSTEVRNGVAFIQMNLHGTRLTISGQMNPLYGNHFGIHVDDFDTTLAQLKAQGVEMITEPRSTAEAKLVFIKDPGGNVIEVIQRL